MAAELGAGLYAWAKTVTALTDLIGSGDDTRFYPVAVTAQKDLPFVIYDEEKDAEAARHEAPAAAATSKVKFACTAATPSDAAALHAVIYSALMVPRFSGLMGSVRVQAVLYESSSPAYEYEEQQFVVDAEYKFCYNL